MSLEEAILRQDEELTDWERLRRKEEAGIEPEPDPEEGECDWSRARLVVPPPKTAISIRLDDDVLEFFKSKGDGYQTRINAVLRMYMKANREAVPAGTPKASRKISVRSPRRRSSDDYAEGGRRLSQSL